MASALYQAVAPQAAYDLTQPVDPDYGRFVEEGQVSRGLKNALLGVSAGSAADAYWQARAANDMPRAQANYLRAQQLAAEAEQAAPRVRSLRDIHGVGDAVDWGAGVMGSLPVSAVPAMGGGLAGGVLGGLVAGPVGAAIGSHLGSSAGMYPQMRDAARLQQMQDEQQGAVPVAPQRVLDDTAMQGALQSGIEGLVPGLASHSLVRGTASNVLRQPVASALKRVGRDIALDTGAAGVSEGVAMGYETGRNPQRDTSGDNWRLADAMAGEAVGGAGFGVVGHAGDVAHNMLGTGAAAAGDAASYAARAGKQGVLGAGQLAKQAWQQRPQSLDEAAVMAGEGAAALHGKAEDVITRFTNRDPDVGALLKPQTGMKAPDLRADDAAKHTAARRMRDKVMAAPDEYPQFVHDALAQYEQGTKSMDSWRPVADAMNDYKRGQGIGEALQKFAQEASLKLGEGAARVMNAKDDALDAYKVKRAVDGRANAQTPDMGHMITDARDEFSPLLDETLAPYTGQKTPDGQAHVLPVLGHAMREWVSNGFSMRPDGEPVVPRALLNMFTNPAEAVTKTVELMHKQGLVDDKVLPLRDKVLERLDVMRMAKEHVGIVIDENLLPTAAKGLSAVDHDLIAEDFMDQIERDKIDSAKARELFGPRARLVLDALRAQMDDARLAERGTEYMPNGGESKGAHGLEDEANLAPARYGSEGEGDGEGVGMDVEGLSQLTASAKDPNMMAQTVTHHYYNPSSKNRPADPYKVGGFSVDPETGEVLRTHDQHADDKIKTLQAKNSSVVKRQGYLDYLRERVQSDDKNYDENAFTKELFGDERGQGFMQRKAAELRALEDKYTAEGKKPPRVEELINKHWYMLREEAQGTKGESTNVDPAEFKDLRPFRNRWVEEASGEKGTAERGRIWLERVDEDGTRTPFATSAARIISNMLGAKKAEGEGASSSLVDQHELLHQGLASLLVALTPEGQTGRVGFKDKADGPVRWLKGGEDLPDNLRMYSSSGGTYQDAKAAKALTKRDELFVDAREALKGWVDRLGHMDPGSYSEEALREQVAAMNDALSRSDAKGVDEILRGAEHARMTADDSKRVKGKLTLKKFATKKAAQEFARGQDVRVVREQLADGSAGGWKVERTVTTPRVEEEGGSDTSEMGKTSEFRTRQEDSPDDGAERYYDETTGEGLGAYSAPVTSVNPQHVVDNRSYPIHTTPLHERVIESTRSNIDERLRRYADKVVVTTKSALNGSFGRSEADGTVLLAREAFTRSVPWANFRQQDSNHVILAHEAGHQLDRANGYMFSGQMNKTWLAANDLFKTLKDEDIMRGWLRQPLDPNYGKPKTEDARKRELFAQLVALHSFKPEMLKKRFEAGYNLVEKAYAADGKIGNARATGSVGESAGRVLGADGRVGEAKPTTVRTSDAPKGDVQGRVILPQTSPYTAKDQAKSDKANKFIGVGSATSSTEKYAIAWGKQANSGKYEATDRVFLSVEGARDKRIALDTLELKKATDAGATIITDTAYDRKRDWNVGEREAAAFLTAQGYVETKPGEWSPGDDGTRNNAQSTKGSSKRFGDYMPNPLNVDDVMADMEMDTPLLRRAALSVDKAFRAEMMRDFTDWTAAQRKAYYQGDLDTFSRLSGYSESEIKQYKESERLLSEVTKKHGEDFAQDFVFSVQKHSGYHDASEHLPPIDPTKAKKLSYGAFINSAENDVPYNAQSPHKAFGIAPSEPASQAEQDAFHANIMKRLGPGMKSGLVEMLYGKNAKGKDIMLSGKWEKGAIYASVYARNLGQIGAHESFHEFFSRMNGVPEAKGVMDILERAANAPYVVRQLERLLDGETEALKQIKQGAKHSVEERMAYMFQFHQAGLLKIGPETENVFTRIAAFLRKVAGLLNDDERADLLLRKFDQGWMHTPDAAARVLAESVTARQHMYESVNAAFKPALQKMSRLVNTAETNLESTGNPVYKEIRRMFKRSVGEDGAQGFLDAKDHQMKMWGSKLANVFEGLNAKDLELAAPYLHTNEKATDPAVKQLIARLKGPDGLLPAMHKYLKEAGVQRWQDDGNGKGHWEPMGKIDHGYFPRAYDTAKIVTNVDEFVADLVKYNESELAAIAAEQNKLLVDSVGKDATLVTTTDVAKAIANRLINGFGQAEIEESNSSIGFSPFMQAVNKRQLHWIHPEMLKKYGDKDVSRVLTSYIAQGVKRAEYVRRFGNGGEILQAKLEKAHTLQLDKLAENEFGANAKDIYSTTSKEKKEDQRRVIEAALTTAGQKNVKERLDALEIKALKTAGAAAKDVMAMEGTLGYDITPKMRRFQNSMMVYQNMRLLTTSLFSQFIDPLNLVVRGGTMTDAWNAYKRGIREVVASIKGDPIKDLDSKIADQVGTADATHFLAAFGQLHSSQYMGDKFRKANDVLFKYNGMEGFNRGMQVSATRAAINFIKRHVQTPNERSAAYLKELNLKAADVKIDDKGELDYADPVIQQAIHQWVNGSVLRPNAAQRPAWASDPHYMIFWHMKQFAYTFHDVILKRAMHDFKKFGDFGPAGVLALTYAPVMVATDALKSVLLTGDEPTWMKGGLDSEINHGVMRAGLMGKFQPFVDVTAPHHNVLGLGGPTVEQMTEMFTDAPTDTAVNALPGANVWNTIKGGGLVDMDEGHTDS